MERESLLAACDPGPWIAWVEGRDGVSGDSFIRPGPDEARGEDLYVTRDIVPAPARIRLDRSDANHAPELIKEVKESRRT